MNGGENRSAAAPMIWAACAASVSASPDQTASRRPCQIISLHREPVWHDRADTIIRALLAQDGRAEQLWARRIDGHHYEICCVPFFLYGHSLGDLVAVDANLNVTAVIRGSGRTVFRVWFAHAQLGQSKIVDAIVKRGGLPERASANLIAVDASSAKISDAIADYLARRQCSGDLLAFERGH